MIAAAFAFLTLCGPFADQDRAITYTTSAAPMKRVFAELSKLANQELKVSKELENEPLILDLRDVSLSDLKARIAETISAEWQREGEAVRLVRTASIRRKWQDAEFEANVQAARKLLEDERRRLGASKYGEAEAKDLAEKVSVAFVFDSEGPAGSSGNPRSRSIDNASPLYRLARKLFLSFDPKSLARLPYEERVVFSDKPTALQRPLPASAANALLEFPNEWDAWQRAAKKKNLDRPAEGRRVHDPNTMYLLESARQAPRKLQKVLFSVRRDWYSPVGSVRLDVVDSNGAVLFKTTIEPGNYWEEARQDGPKPLDSPEEPIEVSALAKEMARRCESAYSASSESEHGPMSDALKELLLNPEKFDPMSLGASELLIGTARARGKQLVAYLTDDSSLLLDSLLQGGSTTPSKALRSLAWENECAVQESGSWLSIRPSKPLRCLYLRQSRTALGQYYRAVLKAGKKAIEAEARYVASMPFDALGPGNLDVLPLQLLAPEKDRVIGQRRGRPALWLHGSLSPSQRITLQSEGLSFHMLDARQQAVLLRAMKEERQTLVRDDAPFETGSSVAWSAFPYWDARTDPTEALNNGFSEDATLAALTVREPSMSWNQVFLSGGSFVQRTSGHAAAQFFESISKDPLGSQGAQKYEWLQPEAAETITYSLRPIPGLRCDLRLSDFTALGPRLTDANLATDEFGKLVEAAKREWRPPPPQKPPP